MKLFLILMISALTILTLYYVPTSELLSLCEQVAFETEPLCDGYVRSKHSGECMHVSRATPHYCRVSFVSCKIIDCQ